jgi:hypothetical protein
MRAQALRRIKHGDAGFIAGCLYAEYAHVRVLKNEERVRFCLAIHRFPTKISNFSATARIEHIYANRKSTRERAV